MADFTSQSAGMANLVTGGHTGDGSAKEIDLGFTPRWVKVFDLTTPIVWEKTEDMPANTSVKTVTAGTTTADTNSAITINEDGFTLSAAANVNAASLAWIAGT